MMIQDFWDGRVTDVSKLTAFIFRVKQLDPLKLRA
jgi:hypothetical protein